MARTVPSARPADPTARRRRTATPEPDPCSQRPARRRRRSGRAEGRGRMRNRFFPAQGPGRAACTRPRSRHQGGARLSPLPAQYAAREEEHRRADEHPRATLVEARVLLSRGPRRSGPPRRSPRASRASPAITPRSAPMDGARAPTTDRLLRARLALRSFQPPPRSCVHTFEVLIAPLQVTAVR